MTINSENRPGRSIEVVVFLLLVGIGVAGRWAQPIWCFTPTAAAAVFAGCYFSPLAIAALVPIAILGVSDLLLPGYNSTPVMLLTYGVMVAPIWFGRLLRQEHRGWAQGACYLICGLAPATLFYVVSNFAVWAFQSDYEASLSGLLRCYVAAVPFYRWMLAGDFFYLSVLLACWAVTRSGASYQRRLSPAAVSDSETRLR